ncbi:hypothetical protein FNV43_RR13799 [Rhamnella rubrinervis]|uniref:Uncharacterized protein n=1 Tax=Rhamnella rubrinervis TaxID=2594499 RepID=A0A8K0MEU3_9ROSA|nr:hypothetical protein FNV43_RR13799 [Rhamnella rubrinervis]
MATSLVWKDDEGIEEPLLNTQREPKEASEPCLLFWPHMILYLTREYGLRAATAANVILLWSSATDFMPILDAFLADSYVGRYPMMGFGSIVCLLGMVLLWFTTIISKNAAVSVSQLLLLYSCYGLMSIGSGGRRSCSVAFGTDQLVTAEGQKNSSSIGGILEKFFSWCIVLVNVSSLVALTCVVYIQEHYGWTVGFGVPAVLMLLSVISFFLASPLHTHLSSADANEYYYTDGSMPEPSEKLRFLNKAYIIRNPQQEFNQDGSVSNPWSVCTASTMDRHLTPSFEIPAGSFTMFGVISLALWLCFYNSLILPLASKLKGQPFHLSPEIRMGIGIVVACVCVSTSAIAEGVRREKAIEEGFSDDPNAVVKMSALWLIPQNILYGIAQAFITIGQMEFYYSELPKTMSSIALTLGLLGMSVGSLVQSFIMSTVDSITRRENQESWLSDNLNKGHFDYYCWLLCGVGVVNFVHYIACSRACVPCQGDQSKEHLSEDEVSH